MPPRRSSLWMGRQPSASPLSMLFGGGRRPSSGSRSSGGGGILNTINNVQRTISTVQRAAPVIQQARQFGPMIKNLPNMYRMIKTIRSLPDSKEEKTSTENQIELSEMFQPTESVEENTTVIKERKATPIKKRRIEYKPSVPKFYPIEEK